MNMALFCVTETAIPAQMVDLYKVVVELLGAANIRCVMPYNQHGEDKSKLLLEL